MPNLRPDQMDYAIGKVAIAMAEGHFGAGIDPAGYMQDARSFVHAFLALDAALEEAEALPDPAAPVEEPESQPDSMITGAGGEPASGAPLWESSPVESSPLAVPPPNPPPPAAEPKVAEPVA